MAPLTQIQPVLNWAAMAFMGEAADGQADDSERSVFASTTPPFAFVYDGEPSASFLATWDRTTRQSDEEGHWEYEARWTDPATRLTVTATARAFKAYPAVEWVLHLENGGTADTPILADIRAADLTLQTGDPRTPVVLHRLHGDSCGDRSFLPYETALGCQQSIDMAPARGRPSQETAFPFFNLEFGTAGVITAIGWSGQWSASYARNEDGSTRFSAGQQRTHLRLHPGERIRTPRVLVMAWQGDRQEAHNRFRRLLLFHYVPQLHGRPLQLPFVLQTFDRYWLAKDLNWASESMQVQAVEAAHGLGCDTYWLDAAWFVGGFPNGVGNWFTKPKEFPRGLGPVSERAHQLGMRFVVWFEPCRVAPGTQIADEHPEFVFGGAQGGLFKLNDPAARRWLTDLLSTRISEYGIDVYREDFNIDPLAFWTANDTPDRVGMTEIGFVEGHYAMWDELRARHPGLWIDNCASGGRRIDLETCMRSAPLWRSDTSCWAGHPEWNQMQSMAVSQYLPLHTACGWEPERYIIRSSATGGSLVQFAYLDPGFPFDRAREVIAEAKQNAKYWYGDYYPLTPATTTLEQFVAYQLHRADLDEGLVLAFRRPQCATIAASTQLRAIDAAAEYELEYIDDEGTKTVRTVAGAVLQTDGLELRLPARGQSLLVRYRICSPT